MPAWVKSFLGVLVGGIAGGAVGLVLLKYGSFLPDVGKFAAPTGLGQILVPAPLIVVFGMPLLGALVGGIIGAVLDDSMITDSGSGGVNLHALMANAWPLILKGSLGLVVGEIVGGAVGMAVLSRLPINTYLKENFGSDAGLAALVVLVIILFGVPILGVWVGGIVGALLALVPAWRRRERRGGDFVTPPGSAPTTSAPTTSAPTTPAPSPGRCPHCGELNSGKALVCVICGRRLPWADSVNRATHAQPAPSGPHPSGPLPSGLLPTGLLQPPQGASTTPAPSSASQLPAPGMSGAAPVNASSAGQMDWLPAAAGGIKLPKLPANVWRLALRQGFTDFLISGVVGAGAGFFLLPFLVGDLKRAGARDEYAQFLNSQIAVLGVLVLAALVGVIIGVVLDHRRLSERRRSSAWPFNIPSLGQTDWLRTATGNVRLPGLMANVQGADGLLTAADDIKLHRLVGAVRGLMNWGIFCAVVSIGLLVFAPWYLALSGMALLCLSVVQTVNAISSIDAVEMDPIKRRPKRAAGAQVSLGAEEKVLATVTGLMHTGWRVVDQRVDHLKNPHNTIVITNRRVFLLFIPLPASDVVVAKADMSYNYFLFGKKKIEEKLGEMLSSMSLEEIINSDAGNVVLSRDDLQPIKPPGSFGPFKSATLTLVTKDGQKYSYYFRDQNELARAVQLLRA